MKQEGTTKKSLTLFGFFAMKMCIRDSHGNAEVMIDYSTGKPMTAHTSDPVPFLWISKDAEGKSLKDGGKLARCV